MSIQILGDKKRVRYDEGLVDKVNEKYKNYKEPEVVVKPPEKSFSFLDLEIEENKTTSTLTFDNSLKRLREAGYERHLRPAEFIKILKEQKNGLLTNIDLLSLPGEWLSLAAEVTEKNKIIFYEDPENLVCCENGLYATRGPLKHGTKSHTTLASLLFNAVSYSQVFPNDFIESILGVTKKDLFDLMDHTIPIHFYFNASAGIYPMGVFFAAEQNEIIIGTCPSKIVVGSSRASRGVKYKSNKTLEEKTK